MEKSHTRFVDEIPQFYDRYLGPFLFDPYARDLARRVADRRPRHVLEIACGTGILTEQLRRALPAGTELVATDLNAPMLEYARGKMPDLDIEWRQADGASL